MAPRALVSPSIVRRASRSVPITLTATSAYSMSGVIITRVTLVNREIRGSESRFAIASLTTSRITLLILSARCAISVPRSRSDQSRSYQLDVVLDQPDTAGHANLVYDFAQAAFDESRVVCHHRQAQFGSAMLVLILR